MNEYQEKRLALVYDIASKLFANKADYLPLGHWEWEHEEEDEEATRHVARNALKCAEIFVEEMVERNHAEYTAIETVMAAASGKEG
ncbi:MAG: hypothetical protein LUI09_01755 [Prevotellaceae bacterium]|nr:hypothetical protein [Prevotellaceae bacterium]